MMSRMDWVYYLLTIALGFAGIVLTLPGLPGLWLMVAASAGFAWLTGYDRYAGTPVLLTLLGFALAAEIGEFLAGAAGSKGAGGTMRGFIGAVIGGIAGAILLTIPVPVIGTIIGACIGTFLGAAIMEMSGRMGTRQSIRVGYGAAKGRLYGTLIKLAVGVVMFFIMLIALLPVG
jgi:uncharacterized protein YqgC (DUF456 family)